jgi:hypothetical protein
MALAAGTFVEGPTGRRGEVVGSAGEGLVRVRWVPMQTLPEETTVEPENAIRVVPSDELGNDPTAPGPGWAPEEPPLDPISQTPMGHVPGADRRST